MAAGPREDRVGQLLAARGGRQLGHRGGGQGPDVAAPRHLRERPQRVGALLGPHRRHDEQPRRAGVPGDVVHELDARLPGVVQVVEDQQQRALRSQPGEHVQHGLERPPPLGLRAGPALLRAAEVVRESGQQPGERRAAAARQHPHVLGRQLAQRLGEDVDERLEEERSFRRVAAADQHPAAGRHRDGGRLVGQPGLAHPGLAREQQHGGAPPARRLPGRTEQGQLGVPADDAGGAGPGGHRRRGALALLAEDRQVHPAGLRRRLDAELVAQRGSQRRGRS